MGLVTIGAIGIGLPFVDAPIFRSFSSLKILACVHGQRRRSGAACARHPENAIFFASICHAITDPPVTKIRLWASFGV